MNMARQRFRSFWVVGFVALACLATSRLAAQEAAKQAQSLKLVPADAATYSAMLRCGEQLEAIAKSKAWARFNALPFVKMAWEKLDEEWNNAAGPLAMVRAWYEQPGNAELIRLLKDLIADEVFIYGGRNSAEFIVFMQTLNAANQIAPLMMLADDRFGAIRPEDRFKFVLKTLAESADDLKIPDMVIGFRVRDPRALESQLKRLDAMVKKLAAEKPEIKKLVQTKKIGGSTFRVLQVSGEMIPWDLIPLGALEDQPGDLDKLIKKIKSTKLTLALGLRDNFLLVGFGEGTGGIEALGKGRPLADVPELKPVAKFADRKLTSITYASKAYQTAVTPGAKDIQEMGTWVMDLLKNAAVPPAVQEKLKKDLKAFAKDMERFFPEPGAETSVSFLTGRGQECYTYDWSKNTGYEASKPLTLLEHLGGNPLFAVAMRYRYDPQEYEVFVKWVKIAYGYVEEFALPMLPLEAREPLEQFLKRAQPHFARLDKATGKMLVPALADGQVAFVVDAKLKSKHWSGFMPPSEKDLPFPELAVVCGVSDVMLLKKAFAEYREAINGLLGVFTEVLPIPVGDLKVPDPQHKKVKGGDLYFYPIPGLLGLDAQIAPSAGLSKTVAAFALSNDHATRLLAKTPLKLDGPLADLRRPLASATYLNWPAVIDAAFPWLEYVLRINGFENDVVEQVQSVMEILKVLRTYASVTYIEDGVLVTRSEIIVKDLEK
jgi:hypothetical protein